MLHSINYTPGNWDDFIRESVDRSHRLAELLMKYMLKQISAEEQAELTNWIEAGNQGLFNKLTKLSI